MYYFTKESIHLILVYLVTHTRPFALILKSRNYSMKSKNRSIRAFASPSLDSLLKYGSSIPCVGVFNANPIFEMHTPPPPTPTLL